LKTILKKGLNALNLFRGIIKNKLIINMSKRRFLYFAMVICLYISGCGSPGQDANTTPTSATMKEPGAGGVDNSKGEGKFKDVKLTHPLDEGMIKNGKIIYDVKCGACHKLTDEKLVGPGWKGVTSRRTPEWIMNFATNTDAMIDKDPTAQELLEKCMVRMPNQHISDDDARNVLEFMRNNDGKN
jgi:cytochrome c2